jgi:hypothetical protein
VTTVRQSIKQRMKAEKALREELLIASMAKAEADLTCGATTTRGDGFRAVCVLPKRHLARLHVSGRGTSWRREAG